MIDRVPKVMFAAEYYPPNIVGGAEISMEQLARALARQGVSIVVVTINHDGWAFKKVKEGSLEIRFVPFVFSLLPRKRRTLLFHTPFFALYFACVLSCLALLHRPDVLHIQSKHMLIPTLFAARLLHIAVTCTLRDPALICQSAFCLTKTTGSHAHRFFDVLRCAEELHKVFSSGGKMSIRNKAAAALIFVDTSIKRWAFKWCDGVIFVSHSLKTLFEKNGLKGRQSEVIYNIPPQDLAGPCRDNGPSESIRDLKRKGGRIVLSAGKLSYGKGTQVLLDAVPEILRCCPDVHVVLAGDPVVPLTISAKGRDRLRFLGRVPQTEMFELYRLTDVVCVPSVWPEPLSRVLLEAMAFEKPIVATDVGGSDEAVIPGFNGFLVPSHDSRALASAVCELLTNEERAQVMGTRGKELLAERFNPAQTVAAHLAHYCSLCS